MAAAGSGSLGCLGDGRQGPAGSTVSIQGQPKRPSRTRATAFSEVNCDSCSGAMRRAQLADERRFLAGSVCEDEKLNEPSQESLLKIQLNIDIYVDNAY